MSGTWRRGWDKVRPAAVRQIKHWLADPDFAGVHGPGGLGRLPEAERRDWQRLWQEVEDLQQRAAGLPKPEAPARP